MPPAAPVKKIEPKKPMQAAALSGEAAPPPPPAVTAPPKTAAPLADANKDAKKIAADKAKPVVQAKAETKDGGDTEHKRGLLYYKGITVPKDFRQAGDWFNKAAAKGHAAAQYNLGFLFYEGKGVQKDDQVAYHWIDQAARLGDRKAAKARETLEKVLPKEIFKKN